MSKNEYLARQWAECVAGYDGTATAGLDADVIAAAEFILENTTPETMADVGWDDTKHFLSGATSSISGTERVMLAGLDFDDTIANVEVGVNLFCSSAPESLTPNGKRYRLVEVTEPGHPEVLETFEDYENAPEGTVVSRPDYHPWVKTGGVWCTLSGRDSSGAIALYTNLTRTVLRWGWGEEA